MGGKGNEEWEMESGKWEIIADVYEGSEHRLVGEDLLRLTGLVH
jgi:hypothetical protein